MEPEIERGIQRKKRGEIERERERKKKEKTNKENENENERERKRERERERIIHIVKEKNSQNVGEISSKREAGRQALALIKPYDWVGL